METVAFLILHYKTINETKMCINSILKLKTSYNIKILIVDNFSNDESSKELLKLSDNIIEVINPGVNLGFSGGNNYGYNYLKKNNNIKYLIVANNDILFVQNNFIGKIDTIYNENRFYILGPDIYAFKKKLHQSPISTKNKSIQDVRNEINLLEQKLEFYKNGIDYDCIGLKNKMRNKINNTKIYKIFREVKCNICGIERLNYKEKYYNACLYGACIIFSKDFLNETDKIFYPETFFYGEEELLFLRATFFDWKIMYDPMLQVLHIDEASADLNYNDFFKKKIFQTNQLINARKEYIKAYLKLYGGNSWMKINQLQKII